MGHPAASVAWLANRLAEHGEYLPAGSLVFSGGLTAAVPIRPGHAVTAEFDDLGTVEVFAPASELNRQTYPSGKA
jgi:2-oxo-3-hexenedioate decarboxylase